jgi:pimeloyl-ACP methyl ester carboxylesterase
VSEALASVLVPGLLDTARLYEPQLEPLWRLGPVLLANHTLDDNLSAIARRILEAAPPRFALIGLSMGGYISFEILRQAPERVQKLVLLDTTARADTPEQTQARREQMQLARGGRFLEALEAMVPRLVHRQHLHDRALRATLLSMAEQLGVEVFVRQQTAIMGRPDSRPMLGAIRCPTLVVVGDGDELTPPDRAREMASGIPGARLAIVPECGHLSTLEQPTAVTGLMLEFLGT